jgi:general stress protein YciG
MLKMEREGIAHGEASMLEGKESSQEAGRKGGERVRDAKGEEFYQEVGHKGGQRVRERVRGVFISSFGKDAKPAREMVEQALEEAGYEVVRVHDLPIGAQLTTAITDAIRESHLVVADISEQNPNVLYELGYAHALGKKTQLLVGSRSSTKSIPSDLAGSGIVFYELDKSDPTGATKDRQELTRRFARIREAKLAS